LAPGALRGSLKVCLETPILPLTLQGEQGRLRGGLGGMLHGYAEGTAMWRSGEACGPFQRVLGLEFAMPGEGSGDAHGGDPDPDAAPLTGQFLVIFYII
jgi:hypothetical protein